MDGVLANFKEIMDKFAEPRFKDIKVDNITNIFRTLNPIDDAIGSYKRLSEHFEVYILSTAPWNNPSAWTDKLLWVKEHLGDSVNKNLILTHNKGLLHGDFLVDDRITNGVEDFSGEHIHFGTDGFETWAKVENYLMSKI